MPGSIRSTHPHPSPLSQTSITADEKQATQLRAALHTKETLEDQLRKHFEGLRNLNPDFSTLHGQRINRIVKLLNSEGSRDDEKKSRTYTTLSECLTWLPFADGKGLAFASTILQHHDALPPERQNPTEILYHFLVCSEIRIGELEIPESAKNHERLEWYALTISALHQHKEKIFFDSGNNAFSKNLRNQILQMIGSLISCMKPGSMQEEDEKTALKARISEIISSRMLPVLESFSLPDKVECYTQLLENLSDLLEEDQREPFALEVFDKCVNLTQGDLTSGENVSILQVMIILAGKIRTFSSHKTEWTHTMRDVLLGHWNNVEEPLKRKIIKTLSLCKDEIDPAEREMHLSRLREAANGIQNETSRTSALLWVDNPEEAARKEQDAEPAF